MRAMLAAVLLLAACGGQIDAVSQAESAPLFDATGPLPVCHGADASRYWNEWHTTWGCRWDHCVDGPNGRGLYFIQWDSPSREAAAVDGPAPDSAVSDWTFEGCQYLGVFKIESC